MHSHRLKKYSLLLFFMLTAKHILFSQTDFGSIAFQYYKMADGLPGDARAVAQDNKGYIWIGTVNGLSRFDGITFADFGEYDKQLGLKHAIVSRIVNLSDSLLGIVTWSGCYVVNIYTMKSLNLPIPDSTDFSAAINHGYDITTLKNGNFLVLSKTGAYEFNRSGRLVYRKDRFVKADEESEEFLRKNDINGEEFLKWNRDQQAFYVHKQLELVNPGTHTITKTNDSRLSRLFAPNVIFRKKISESSFIFLNVRSDSLFYLNALSGAVNGFRLPFDASSEKFYVHTHVYALGQNEFALTSCNGGFYSFTVNSPSDITILPERFCAEHHCNFVFKDQAGRLWLGTDEGLLKQTNYKTPFKTVSINADEKENQIYNNIFVMNDKIFITNCPAENTLIVLDRKTKQLLRKITFSKDDKESFFPYEMQSYYKDTLWISTRSGIVWLDANTLHFGKVKGTGQISYLEMMPVNSDGNAWMTFLFSPFYVRYNVSARTFDYYDQQSAVKPFPKKQTGLFYDASGNVWFFGTGMQRWNSKKNYFDTLIMRYGKSANQELHIAYAMPGKKDNTWLYLEDNQFMSYNIRNNHAEFIHLDAPAQSYQTFSKVNADFLWAGYTGHLLQLNTQNKHTNLFDQNDGVPDVFFSSLIVYDKNNNEYLVCAGGKTLISFPGSLTVPPKKDIQVEYITAGNNYINYNPPHTLVLDHTQNTLNIKFNVLDFDQKYPEKFIYNIDNGGTWNAGVQAQPIFLYDLTPGWHQVSVKSVYNQKKYNPLLLKIFIEPPFWKKLWFMLLCIVFGALVIFVIIRLSLKRIKKKNALMLQLKEFEIKALHAQMNPHFIFNCLNSIKALIVQKKNDEASKYINSFSKLVRLNLEHSRKPFITLDENMSYIELYLQSEQLRFNFSYNIHIHAEASEAGHIKVVPMLLQPIIENAIWHGLQSIQTERIVTIAFEQHKPGEARFVIDDNGIGIKTSLQLKQQAEKRSVGMENIRERIHLFNQKHKLNYRMEVMDKSGLDPQLRGTRVTIYFNF